MFREDKQLMKIFDCCEDVTLDTESKRQEYRFKQLGIHT